MLLSGHQDSVDANRRRRSAGLSKESSIEESFVLSNEDETTCLNTFNVCGLEDNIFILVCLFVGTTSFTLAQLIGAHAANSLAMYGDSATMMLDSLTYLLNIYCEKRKINGSVKSLRLEVTVASISVAFLAFVTLGLLYESLKRLHDSQPGDNSVDADIMMEFSLLNLVIDVVSCSIFLSKIKRPKPKRRRGRNQEYGALHTDSQLIEPSPVVARRNSLLSIPPASKNVNMASAFLHLGADTLRTLTVLITAIIVNVDSESVDSTDADAIGSIVVCIIILAVVIALIFELVGLSVSLSRKEEFEEIELQEQSGAF